MTPNTSAKKATYIRYSAKVYSVYLKYFSAEDIHVYSVDEVFIDITPCRAMYACSAHDLVRMVIQDILWSHTPITDFWQIAGGISGKLAKYGIRTMGDIAETSIKDEEFLYRLFGINAELLSLQMIKEEVTADSMTMYIGYEICSDSYTGLWHYDWYGRKIPAHSVGTFRFGTDTNYSGQIISAASSLFLRIAKPGLPIRRIFVTVNNIKNENTTFYQMDLFHNTAAMEREKRLQKAVLAVKARYGANAILRGMSLQNGARTIERNRQIGGHKA